VRLRLIHGCFEWALWEMRRWSILKAAGLAMVALSLWRRNDQMGGG